MAEMRYGAAWSAVTHSEGNGALEQVLDVGAMMRSCDAADAPAARVWRKEVLGMVAAHASVNNVRGMNLVNIVIVFGFSRGRMCVVRYLGFPPRSLMLRQ